MSITLITAVPGGGKTAYAVWFEIKKAHEKGRTVYTSGIPQLTIPTIELTYPQIKEWYVRDETGELPQLVNIEHGSIIVVDEVQKLWPAFGKGDTADILDLTEHRHFGLSFVLITQSPTLIHRNVLALVDRHLHIRPTWAGRKIYEWPEYNRNPSAPSNRQNAIAHKYKLPKESFKLYHSATQHIKPQKSIPKAFYVFFTALILSVFFVYTSVASILGKTTNDVQPPENHQDNLAPVQPPAKAEQQPQTKPEPAPMETIVETEIHDPFPTLVSNRYDWGRIAACLTSETVGCICYGYSGERLAIPRETCDLATKYGWSSGRPGYTTALN